MASQAKPATNQSDLSQESQTSTDSFTEVRGNRKNEVHLVLQGKGGVGKSFIATLLADFFSTRVSQLRCFDTDPQNPTFTTYKQFNVELVEILGQDHSIDPSRFDRLMEAVTAPDIFSIIDNGSSTFLPLMNYCAESGAFEVLADSGKEVVPHIVVAGGDAASTTIDGFEQLMNGLPETIRPVVWLNELHGPVALKNIKFEDLGVVKEFWGRIRSTVVLPAPRSQMFARDIQEVRKLGMTFGQAAAGEPRPDTGVPFFVMERQRFKMMQRQMFEEMQKGSV
ncbi:hypothetical protein [Acidocella sp.]|uniref:nucleotide-binding protein n=1 Tax=Acidocella sp. TaxID=50710 RepID=UPI003CFFDB6D